MNGSPTIHDLVRRQTADRPDAVAVCAGDVRLTYRELDSWSDRIARLLLDSGVVPGDPVAVAVRRSLAYPAAVLGILKAGGAYVPLDPDYPADRRAYVLANSGATAVLTTVIEADQHVHQVAVPELSEGPDEVGTLPTVDDRQVAYIIYTSGSTGKPKGVLVEHRQVVALVHNDPRLHVQPGQRVALFASLAFDATTFELWNTLCR